MEIEREKRMSIYESETEYADELNISVGQVWLKRICGKDP